MRAGQITKYQPQGWHERRTRYADALLGAHHRLRARPVPASQAQHVAQDPKERSIPGTSIVRGCLFTFNVIAM